MVANLENKIYSVQIIIFKFLVFIILINSCTYFKKIQHPEALELIHNISINENYLIENINNKEIISEFNKLSKPSPERVKYLSVKSFNSLKNGYHFIRIKKQMSNVNNEMKTIYIFEVQSKEFRRERIYFEFIEKNSKLLLFDIGQS